MPTNSPLPLPTVRWLLWYNRVRPQDDVDVLPTAGWGIAEGRNLALDAFRRSDADVLWMLDSDVTPPYNTSIFDHIDAHPVLCGPYHGWMHRQRVWHVYRARGADWEPWPEEEWPRARVFRAAATGAGCMLIRRDLVKQLPARPFAFGWHSDGTPVGEDLTFCRSVGGVAVDKLYQCGHHKLINLKDM